MSVSLGHSSKKRILLAGASPDVVRLMREELGSAVHVIAVGKEDTLAREMLTGVELIVMDFSDGDTLAMRIGSFITESTPVTMVYYLASAAPTPEAAAIYPNMRPLPVPIDFSYLRGLIDCAHEEKARIRHLDEDRSRVRLLYEMSSSLLKVTSRRHIPKALDQSLPRILNASFILLSFPQLQSPIGYTFASEGIGELKLQALKSHLSSAWDVLRPDAPVNWDWVMTLGTGRPASNDHRVRPTSFVSAPIDRGNQTEGFLTFLPIKESQGDEAFLQTFFVIGDLISVLIQNLHLKERLEQRATHDGLTKLLNRQTLMEQLEKECRRSLRYGTPVSVVMLDLDFFKSVNDRYGHMAGDETLRQTAAVIQTSIREMDFAGRCGGEEFIIVLPSTEIDGAMVWAERLRQRIEDLVIRSGEHQVRVTASMGVATVKGPGAVTDQLLVRADLALYAAKADGRNRVHQAT